MKNKKGSIEVICGSMFSGKTEELIRRTKRALIAKQKVVVFKPVIDNRYNEKKVCSHNKNNIDSVSVNSSKEILKMIDGIDVIGIDEAQFFDEGIVDVCNKIAFSGKRVIIAGLDMDYLGKPFGSVPFLLSIADEVVKTQAVCMNCGDSAYISHRKNNEKQKILIGEKESYEPLCRKCYSEKQQPNGSHHKRNNN